MRAERGEREDVNFHDRKREIDKSYAERLVPYKTQLAAIQHSINAIKKEAKDELMSEFIARLYEGAVFEAIDDGPSGGETEFTVTGVFNSGVRLKHRYGEEYHTFASLIWEYDWFSFKVGE